MGSPEGREWGFVTNSGTDGNMHGIYYGAKKLQKETGTLPVVYVSEEAHYSSFRLCDVQNPEVKLIRRDEKGRMDPECLRKALDPKRPALLVIAVGSTFMGGRTIRRRSETCRKKSSPSPSTGISTPPCFRALRSPN